jgi:predicted DNA-binding transcriptional regulator YafY
MRPTNRLFQIIQILRRSSRPVTAADLADELEVSKRTIYRDIAELMSQRVPIEGEAGFGYVLSEGYDLPPLMLTADEIEAVYLGARWVTGLADKALSNAAHDVIAKISAAIPEHLRCFISEPSVGSKPPIGEEIELLDTSLIRSAIRTGHKLQFRYRREDGLHSKRTVWPVLLGYSDANCILIAWCELRGDFRHFCLSRMKETVTLPEPIGLRKSKLRKNYLSWREKNLG